MIIAVIGKGGVGKTTTAALLIRRLVESGRTPVLAIDADPSSCLGSALGISVLRTLGDLRESLREGGDKPGRAAKADVLAIRAEEAIVESRGFDLLTMGRPEGPGCYCFVNNAIREHLDRLSRAYRHVVIDCEAGLEHLSRRTTGRPDLLVCVTSGSRMGAETVRRGLGIYRALHGTLPRLHLVQNNLAEGKPIAELTALASAEGVVFDRVISVPADAAVGDAEARGATLLQLGTDSPAVLATAGWEIEA